MSSSSSPSNMKLHSTSAMTLPLSVPSPTGSISNFATTSAFTVSYLARSGIIAFAILTPAILFILQTLTLSHKGLGLLPISLTSSHHLSSPHSLNHFSYPSSQNGLYAPHTQKCNQSIFYNKPPKTASTFIQVVIGRWVHYPYNFNTCGGKRALETNLYLPDCLPRVDDGCTIFSAHVKLNEDALSLVHTRLPNALKITSTRYPAHRIMSFFLQINRLKSWEDGDAIDDTRLQNWLRTYNPWALFNYHTGESRAGTCPLSSSQRADIFDVATKYDLVIDANLVNESNVILSHYNLFNLPLPEMDVTANVRGTLNLNFSEPIKKLIRKVSCVEDELHRAFHMRMASLYERITGKECIKHGDINELGSCMDDYEMNALEKSWTV